MNKEALRLIIGVSMFGLIFLSGCKTFQNWQSPYTSSNTHYRVYHQDAKGNPAGSTYLRYNRGSAGSRYSR